MFYPYDNASSINRETHRCLTGNTLEVYREGKVLAKAHWHQDTPTSKRRIVVDFIDPAFENQPSAIKDADKVVERDAKGHIVDNFKPLKGNLKGGSGEGRPLVSWAQAFGWLTHA